jgi:FkbM family methyltransferase
LDDSYAGFKHEDCQYFNGLTLHRFSGVNSCIYVDCGAYNGDTFLQANESLPLTRAYLFEPDPINFKHLVQVVKHASIDSVCLPLAISDHYEVLSFAGDGEGGTITLDGSLHIAAVSLDELMPHAMVDFIKFDIEGSEVPAILGAIELIKRSRPTLVLSLYHRPADLWEIPILLANCCHGYKFYIRQHFNNSFDSVLYAIPS